MRTPRYAQVTLEFESGGNTVASLYVDIADGDGILTPYALLNAPAQVLTPEYIRRWVEGLPDIEGSDWEDYAVNSEYRVY